MDVHLHLRRLSDSSGCFPLQNRWRREEGKVQIEVAELGGAIASRSGLLVLAAGEPRLDPVHVISLSQLACSMKLIEEPK